MHAPVVQDPPEKLNAADRCDRCGAQAMLRVRKGKQVLDFCRHHEREFRTKLLTTGWAVIAE